MVGTSMQYRGSLARLLVREPGCSYRVRFILGDRSFDIWRQDDSGRFIYLFGRF